ncbi:hypothetical protein ACODT3_41250 [Streptomyces sp. 4.24]|uniref:hypothetical protein n=1 Tax=Streptomyces tritrimontium TaxID=3406573 RepID=UPI003BB564C8
MSVEELRDLLVEVLRADPRFADVDPTGPSLAPDPPGIAVVMAAPVDLDFLIEVRTG